MSTFLAAPRSQAAEAPSPSPLPFTADRVESTPQGSRIHFSGQAAPPLQVPLFELEILGKIQSSEGPGAHYLVTSAKPCESCDQEKAVYLLRLQGGVPNQFVYPGRVIDPKSGKIVLQSRAFFGKCLRGSQDEAYVVFQKEQVDRRNGLRSSVYIAEPGKEFLVERLIARRMPSMDFALQQVRKKRCFEIPPRNRVITAKMMNLTPKREIEEIEPEEETTKENQTQSELPSPPESLPDPAAEAAEGAAPSAPEASSASQSSETGANDSTPPSN